VANLQTSNVVTFNRKIVAAGHKAAARDKRQKTPFSLAARRLTELQRLYRARWGDHLPDDDAGRDDLLLAFNHIASVDRCIEWAAQWAPWLSRDDASSLAEQVRAAPQWLKARPLGERLGLTDTERTALGIRTARPIDVTDADLIERRKHQDCERKRRKRQEARTGKPAPASQGQAVGG
jgi:hypothetical protein